MEPFATGSSGLITRLDFVRAGRNDRALRRAVARGELVTLVPGIFVEAAAWRILGARDRHLLRSRAVVEKSRPGSVLSHVSASAVHGWQLLKKWPDLIDLSDPSQSRSRRGALARVHGQKLAASDVDVKRGLPVTAAGRTAVDAALSLPFRDAIVTLDSALAALSREEEQAERRGEFVRSVLQTADFDAALERRLPVRAHNHVARVRAFASGLSGSAGESFSRVVMDELGLPRPILQQPFSDQHGLIGYVDYWWPELGVIGESDGYVKYSRGEYLHGLSPAEAAVKEKRREDRLRAHPRVRGFARWMWADIDRPTGMAAALAAAGVRAVR